MKRYNTILESQLEPSDKNVLWLRNEKIKQFISGGWKDISGISSSNINEDDLSFNGDKIEFSNRKFDKNNNMGYIILRKNMLNKPILTQDMISSENTVYEIRYNFDLNGESLIIPNNSVLKFTGGSFSNFKEIILTNTEIVSDKYEIFNVGTIINKGDLSSCNGDFKSNITGTIKNKYIPIEWFGGINDSKFDNSNALQFAINCSHNLGVTVLLTGSSSNSRYMVSDTIYLPATFSIKGNSIIKAGKAELSFLCRYFFRPKKEINDSEQQRLNKRITFTMSGLIISGYAYSNPELPQVGTSPAKKEAKYKDDPFWVKKTYLFYGGVFSRIDIHNIDTVNIGVIFYGKIIGVSRIYNNTISYLRAFVLGGFGKYNERGLFDSEQKFNIKGVKYRELGYETSIKEGDKVFNGFEEEIEGYTTPSYEIIDSYICNNYINSGLYRGITFLNCSIATTRICNNYIDFAFIVFCNDSYSYPARVIIRDNIIDYCYISFLGYIVDMMISDNIFHHCDDYRICRERLFIYPWDYGNLEEDSEVFKSLNSKAHIISAFCIQRTIVSNNEFFNCNKFILQTELYNSYSVCINNNIYDTMDTSNISFIAVDGYDVTPKDIYIDFWSLLEYSNRNAFPTDISNTPTVGNGKKIKHNKNSIFIDMENSIPYMFINDMYVPIATKS